MITLSLRLQNLLLLEFPVFSMQRMQLNLFVWRKRLWFFFTIKQKWLCSSFSLLIQTPVLSLLISCQVRICRFAKPKARPAVPRKWRSAIRWPHAATWSLVCKSSVLNSNVLSSTTLPYSKVSSERSLFQTDDCFFTVSIHFLGTTSLFTSAAHSFRRWVTEK